MSDWADGFAVAWDRMERTGTGWSTPADRLAGTGELIGTVLAAAPWGGDQYAEQFKLRIAEKLGGLVEGCRRGAESVHEMAELAGTAAGRYRDTDRPYGVQV